MCVFPHGQDHAARLVKASGHDQNLFGRSHDAPDRALDHPDPRLARRSSMIDIQIGQQLADAIFIAVRMLALEPAGQIAGARLEVGRSTVQRVGMLINPRAGDVMLSGIYLALIQALAPERGQNWIFRWARGENIIAARSRIGSLPQWLS